MVGLSQTRMRAVGEFSKGMQRRIGLAQALINDPDLVILDEPTSGLDPIGCREVKDLILALARRGKTVILSSHLLADVEDVCDRVVIYYGGKVQAMGTLKELLATPDAIRITTPALPRETHGARARSHSPGRRGGQSQDRYAHAEPRALFPRRGADRPAGRGGNLRRHVRRPRRRLPARRGGSRSRPSDKILERLAAPQAAAPAPAPRRRRSITVSQQKLAALTKPAEPVALRPRQRPRPRPVSEAELRKADEKLASLVKKPKGPSRRLSAFDSCSLCLPSPG